MGNSDSYYFGQFLDFSEGICIVTTWKTWKVSCYDGG